MANGDTGLPDFVQSARDEAQAASRTAGDFASAALTVSDQLRNTINEAVKANEDLFERNATALSEFLAAPDVAEAKFGTEFLPAAEGGAENPDFIFNPFQRNRAIAQFISNKEIPFLTTQTLLGQVIGSGERMIDAGTRAFQAQTVAQQAAADAARQTYQDVLNEFVTSENLRFKQEELDLAKRRASGSGRSLDPFKQNTALTQLLAGAQSQLQDAYLRNQANDPNGEGFIGTGEVDAVFDELTPMLQRIGISPEEINSYRESAYDEFGAIPSFSSGSLPEEPKSQGFFNRVGQTLSNFLGVGQSPVAGDLNLDDIDFDTSNIQRGVSNTNNFMNNFDFGGNVVGPSAQLRR